MDDLVVGLPLLSIHDPEEGGMTSLDPLGLVLFGEKMDVELAPAAPAVPAT